MTTDATDSRIIGLLAEDGRRSNRDIARIAGVPEKQVAARIRRLHGERLRIAAVVDVFAAGFEFMLNVGVQVSGRPAVDVARELARHPEVLSVALVSGPYEIEIVLVARDQDTLARFVQVELRRVSGVRALAPSLRLEVFKFETGLGPFVEVASATLDLPDDSGLDALERGVIHALWDDPRATNQAIAERLATSESTVRARIAALRVRGVLWITAQSDLRIGAGRLLAFVEIDLGDVPHADVARDLCRMPEVRFVSAVLGRCDLLAMVLAADAGELSQLVHERIARLRGVRAARCAPALRFVKYDRRWALIRPMPHGSPSPPFASSTAPLTADA
jgi:DNA-binding Lrp family transcriptional regulator